MAREEAQREFLLIVGGFPLLLCQHAVQIGLLLLKLGPVRFQLLLGRGQQHMAVCARMMYERGEESYLDALLEGKGLSDILNRMDQVEKVYQYENTVLEDYIGHGVGKLRIEVVDLLLKDLLLRLQGHHPLIGIIQFIGVLVDLALYLARAGGLRSQGLGNA